MPSLLYTSGVQDPDFGVQSGRIFGFGLDIVSLSTGPDYPNEIKSGHAKKS